MGRTKKIFLSSTCFDLIDLRAELKSALTDSGYVVHISEAPDFPVDPNISAHDNCLRVVRESDIYLLIIHTKYGSRYAGKTEVNAPEEFSDQSPSVTVAEYLTALDAGLEVRIWVRDFIWTAASDPSRGRFETGVVLPSGIDCSVFTFIDYIKNHPHEGGSWINQFHDVVDLKASIVHWLGESSYMDVGQFRLAVAEICDLLGYEFDRTLMLAPTHTRVLARRRTSPFDEQDAIWPVFRQSGSPIIWRDLREIVHDVADEVTCGICDRALVVTSSSFDASVSAGMQAHPMCRRMRVITYDDLLSTLLPFTDYLQRIVHDFEHYEEFANPDASNDPVIDIMRRCDLFRYYVPLRGRCSPNDLYQYVQEWLTSPNANQLTLLGDFGTGKSSFALWLTYVLAKKIVVEGRQGVRIPIFISLRDHVGKIDVREIVINTLVNTYRIRNASYDGFLKLMDAGRLLIIFDGFDETATRTDVGQSLRILRELNSLVRRGAKIILSCRTNYFRTDIEAHTQLEKGLRSRETELFTEQKGRTNFDIVYLKEFDPIQIEEFLSKHFHGDKERTKQTLTTMHSTYNLWDLARRPVLLEMILKVFPRLSRKLGRVAITPAELYEEYIEEWLVHVAKGNEESLDSGAKRTFCDNLAQWMYKNERELLPYAELETLVHEYFAGRPLAAYAALDMEVRTCSFLNRDSSGNYQFVHRSFMEFFVAKAISKELELEKYDLLSAKPISFEIGNFLRGLLPNKEPYLRAIESTKIQPATAGCLGRNAISMLTLLGFDFRGCDFSHSVLIEADFSSIDLTECKFRGANLHAASLANAVLTNADFTEADLTRVDVQEVRRISCIAWAPDTLVIGGEDGSVRVYSSITWELKAVLRQHPTTVHAAVVSAAGEFLFTISDDRLVAWSLEGLTKFAEFHSKSGEVGPLRVKFSICGYEVTVLSEHQTVFVPSSVYASIDNFNLSVRTYNCLKNLGAKTMRDVVRKTESELLASKNFGKKSLNELKDIFDPLGLSFGTEIPEQPLSTNAVEEPYVINLLERAVSLHDKENKELFISPSLDEKPEVASYSVREARLAVGTTEGRVIIWDIQTSMELSELEQGRLDCRGMLLADAKGLDAWVPGGFLGEWLAQRGAVLTPSQHRSLRARFDR